MLFETLITKWCILFDSWFYHHIGILESVILSEQKVSKEPLQENWFIIDFLYQVAIIVTNKCITEVPRMTFEHFVVDAQSHRAKVFDDEYCSSTCISLAKRMYLPQSRCELCKMFHHLFFVQERIIEQLFLFNIIGYGFTQVLPTTINHTFAAQYPFLFRDIVITETSCMLEYTLEDGSMY